MCLASVLVSLNHSKGRESLETCPMLEDTGIDAPSCGTTGFANCTKSLLRVQVAVSGVEGDPVDEVI